MSGRDDVRRREAEEEIGAGHRFGQVERCALLGEVGFFRIDRRVAGGMHETVDVVEPDVLLLDAELDEQVEAGDAGGATAGRDELDVLEAPVGEIERIGHGRTDDDRSAMLVVVEDRDVHALLAQLLDDEAVRRLDVLEVDGAEGRLQRDDVPGQFFRIRGVEFDVEAVDSGEFLEQDGLAFHDRLRGERTDIAETEHGRAVRHHGDQVAARRIARDSRRIVVDGERRVGDARRIGERQIARRGKRLGRARLQFAGARVLVVAQRGTALQVVGLRGHLGPGSGGVGWRWKPAGITLTTSGP